MHLFIKEGRLRAPWRVFFYVIAYFLGYNMVQIPIAFLYVLYLLRSGREITTVESLPFSLLIAASGAASLAVLLITLLFCRFLDKGNLLDLGLRRKSGWLKRIGMGLALGILLMGFIFAFELMGGWLRIYGYAWQIDSPSLVMGTLWGYILLYVFVAFNEELGFRGYILKNLREEWGGPIALLFSSAIFALFHGFNPHINLLGFLGIGLAGILLGYSYLITGSLWLPMALHFAWNFAEGPLFSFPVSGLSSDGLLLVESQGPSLFTGGPFGPEGGLIGIASTFLGLLLLHLWSKRERR